MGLTDDVYAQHILSTGTVDGAWPVDGRALCTATNDQYPRAIVADGAGGAIVTWADLRAGSSNSDIYAQHVLSSGAVDASWPGDGRGLCTFGGEQSSPTAVSDGAGGAIVTWQDRRSGTNYDIYAQRVHSCGELPAVAQCVVDGAPLCSAVNLQQSPAIASDGAQGAIVTWEDHRASNYNIYAQHFLSTGSADPAWPVDGRKVCIFTDIQQLPTIVADGAGGAIVAWQDFRSGSNWDIYAQHVLSTGALDPAWPVLGKPICTTPQNQQAPRIVSDGAGGAIVTWYDAIGTTDIYAQHVLASGVVDAAWPSNGRALCAAAGQQINPVAISDGNGGAIVTWNDYRDDPFYPDIYAQRVRASGVVDPDWTADGQALCTAPNNQSYPTIASDGAAGAIVTWMDSRSGSNSDIYVQHVLSDGSLDPVMPLNGLALCTAASNQTYPTIVADGADGAIVAWSDLRSGATSFDIYAQHVLSSATVDPAWPSDGRALCTAADNQTFPTIVSDGAGGAIVTWQDNRTSSISDIYSQHVQSSGTVDGAWPVDGRALCTAANTQIYPQTVSDGSGGLVATWGDNRYGGDIYAQHVYASGGIVAVAPEPKAARFMLLSPYPNPVGMGDLTIRFVMPATQRVSARVFDLAGHLVQTLALDREFLPGPQALKWDGRDRNGAHVPSGVYFVQVRAGASANMRQIVLLR
jgi:flagellar hook capping protein FlgD